jgi:16S rRNA (cytidine1402-2'-O)-methyltransferase
MEKLYIVSTPIGNLKDISLRAIEVLKKVETVICEDTREFRKLQREFELGKKKLVVLNEFNDPTSFRLVTELRGEKAALVSDGGTPLLSDPGFKLVRKAIEEGMEIEIVPGASALLTGLVGSGLPMNEFVFLGFLPKKIGKKTKKLEMIKNLYKNGFSGSVVLYESPYRIVKNLELIKEILGEIQVMVGRELTKKFEEWIRGSVDEVRENLENRKKIKGELVIVLHLD